MDPFLVLFSSPYIACQSVQYSPSTGSNTTCRPYADDTQLYVEFPRNRPTDAENAAHRIGNCVTDLKRWLADHQLLLNESKTEAIAFNVPSCKVTPAMTDINMCGCNITLQQTVRDIGVFLDSGMDMSAQVSRMCQSAYFQLHNIAKIRHCLTVNACKTIVHALVTSKLDYGNAVLFGINERLINKLQITQNSAARLIMRQRRRDHITPVLIALHWLPIRYRILYKVLVLTFQAVHNLAPMYVTDLISVYEPGRQLRSASRSLLTVPHHNLDSQGWATFSERGPGETFRSRSWAGVINENPKMRIYYNSITILLLQSRQISDMAGAACHDEVCQFPARWMSSTTEECH